MGRPREVEEVEPEEPEMSSLELMRRYLATLSVLKAYVYRLPSDQSQALQLRLADLERREYVQAADRSVRLENRLALIEELGLVDPYEDDFASRGSNGQP